MRRLYVTEANYLTAQTGTLLKYIDDPRLLIRLWALMVAEILRRQHMAQAGKNWIGNAVAGGKGKLHKALGVKQGTKIPAGKLAAAAGKSGKVGKEARLAKELRGFKK